jgi:hypothetical protein
MVRSVEGLLVEPKLSLAEEHDFSVVEQPPSLGMTWPKRWRRILTPIYWYVYASLTFGGLFAHQCEY